MDGGSIDVAELIGIAAFIAGLTTPIVQAIKLYQPSRIGPGRAMLLSGAVAIVASLVLWWLGWLPEPVDIKGSLSIGLIAAGAAMGLYDITKLIGATGERYQARRAVAMQRTHADTRYGPDPSSTPKG